MDITINPFITSGKIPAELFCDRKEETKTLIRKMTSGANIVLMSPRRVGKTQLIYHCFDKPVIKDNYIVFFVDILKTSSIQEFTYELGKSVFNTLASKGQKMQKLALATMKSLIGNITIDPMTSLPVFGLAIGNIQNPSYSLEEIFKTLEFAGKKCIVAIDEFQQITNYSARPFYNSADIQSLEILEEDKYTDFVNYHFSTNERKIDSDSISYVYHLFEGNTYYNQKTFREAYAQTPKGSVCKLDIIKNSISLMIKEADHHYSELLSRLTLPQKELLYAIAHDGHARQITSGAFIRRHHLTSASSVQQAIKKLLSTGLITSSIGEYYVADQLMYLWLTGYKA